MRLHMCQVYVCTAQDMVLCVEQASLRVSCCVVLWPGRFGGLTRKDGSLPSLRGGPHAVAAPATWTDLLGARAERVPDYSSYLSRIPGQRAMVLASTVQAQSLSHDGFAQTPD